MSTNSRAKKNYFHREQLRQQCWLSYELQVLSVSIISVTSPSLLTSSFTVIHSNMHFVTTEALPSRQELSVWCERANRLKIDNALIEMKSQITSWNNKTALSATSRKTDWKSDYSKKKLGLNMRGLRNHVRNKSERKW